MLLLVICGVLISLQIQAATTEEAEVVPDYLQHILDFSSNCNSELNITASDLPKMVDGKLPEDNEDLTAFFGCLWVKLGILNENGAVDPEKMKEFLTSASTMFIPSVIEKCKTVEGADNGQKAIKMQNCILQETIHAVKQYYS